MDFARQSDEKRKPIQIDLILKEVLKFIRSTLPTTTEIKQNIETDSMIMGNSIQIQRVIMNLCTNAAHAMENKGGMLEISLKDVTIENDELIGTGHLKFGNYIEIKISDTSYGINPQIINKIYEPKGQVWDSPLFFGIVEIYGGKINVESTVGKGTTFTIYLPTTKGQ